MQDPEFNTLQRFRSGEGGVLLVDKPVDWTSFDVVKKVRGTLRVKKVGHAGTLDPLATGLLILCSGKMTKQIDRYQALRKTYIGSMRLGAETASFDAATEPVNPRPYHEVTRSDIERAAERFTGDISQIPPMYSAVQIKGTRLYTLARKGKTVEREPRQVTVHRFQISSYEPPDAGFEVECSKGTYVRTLAHDLGADLGCGAYLTALRRTSIGEFSVGDAWTIERIVEAAASTHTYAAQETTDT